MLADTPTTEKEGVEIKIAPETQKLNWYVVTLAEGCPVM